MVPLRVGVKSLRVEQGLGFRSGVFAINFTGYLYGLGKGAIRGSGKASIGLRGLGVGFRIEGSVGLRGPFRICGLGLGFWGAV